MKVGQILTQIRNLVGDPNKVMFSDDTLGAWIDNGIRECIVQNNLCQKSATSNLVAGTTDYSLPTDIFKLHSIMVDGDKIPVYTLEEWQQRNQGPVGSDYSGRVVECYVWASKLVLSPAPDNTYQLRVNYIYEPPAIVPANINDELPVPAAYHERLVVYVLAQTALQDEDLYKYNNLMQQFRSGVIDLKTQQTTEEDLYPFGSVSARDMGEEFYPW